jgi:hypothetical protein
VLVFNYKTPFSVVRSRYLRNAIRPNGSFSCEYPNLVRSGRAAATSGEERERERQAERERVAAMSAVSGGRRAERESVEQERVEEEKK